MNTNKISDDRRKVTIYKREWRKLRDETLDIINRNVPPGVLLDGKYGVAGQSFSELHEHLVAALYRLSELEETPSVIEDREYFQDLLSLFRTEFTHLKQEYEKVSSKGYSGRKEAPSIAHPVHHPHIDKACSSHQAMPWINPVDSKENTNPNPQRITSSEAQLAELMTSIELEKKTIELHELKLRKAQLFNVNISDRESATSSQEGDSTWGYYNGRNNLTEKIPPPPGTEEDGHLSPIKSNPELGSQQTYRQPYRDTDLSGKSIFCRTCSKTFSKL